MLAIKDMAGLLRAPAAAHAGHRAARAVRPAGAPAHPRHRGRPARPRCWPRSTPGVDAVDVASASMAGTTSQPPMSALVAATDGTDARHRARPARGRATWSPTGRPCAGSTRRSSPGCPSPTGRVYTHEIPGGQLSNLRQQAIALGLGDKFEAIEDMYAAANRILGNIVKVTPSSARSSATSPWPWSAPAPTRPTSRPTRARTTSPTRSSASCRASWATRPAAGRSRSAPRPWQGRSGPSRGVTELDDEDVEGAAPTAAAAHPQPAAVPRADQGVRGQSRDTYCDLSVLRHRASSCTG